MTNPRKTGFDRYLARRMAGPKFAAEYAAARAEIDASIPKAEEEIAAGRTTPAKDLVRELRRLRRTARTGG